MEGDIDSGHSLFLEDSKGKGPAEPGSVGDDETTTVLPHKEPIDPILDQEIMELTVALEKSRQEMGESTSSTSVSDILSASELWSRGDEAVFDEEPIENEGSDTRPTAGTEEQRLSNGEVTPVVKTNFIEIIESLSPNILLQ